MTLLILLFRLDCTDSDGRFEDVRAIIEFEDNEDTGDLEKARPEVVA